MNRVQLEPAYLLHQYAYRETSSLLEVFSITHGRVGLVARGARGPKARWRSVFQPFQRLLLSWSERGELGTLTGGESAGPPPALRGDTVFSGWYLNELLLRCLARHDPHPALFEHYAATLEALAASSGAAAGQAALRRFELTLLEQLGYGLHLSGEIEPDRWYEYQAESGPCECREQPGAYRGASLLGLAAGRLESQEALRDARRLLQAALAPHLGEKPLQTPRMLRSLKEGTRGEGRGAREQT